MSGSFGPGFRALDAAESPDALLEFLDRFASVPAVRSMKREATRALGLGPGDRVLDVGCGTGVDLLEMLEQTLPGGSVVGIDSSSRAVEAAANRLAAVTNVAVEVADVHNLPYPHECFDAVRADRVLLHLEKPDLALAEIKRVLVPRGRLVVLESWSRLEGDPAVVTDPVHRALLESMWAPGVQPPGIELFLPVLFATVGFAPPTVEQGTGVSASFADADAALRLRAGAAETVAADRTTPVAARAWLERLEASFTAGSVWLRFGFVRLGTKRP